MTTHRKLNPTGRLTAITAAVTLSLAAPALASPTRDLDGTTAATASPTAHIEPWLGPTHDPAHHAHRAHSYIQMGGPMIRVNARSGQCGSDTQPIANLAVAICLHDAVAAQSRPTHCRISSTCKLARLVREWA